MRLPPLERFARVRATLAFIPPAVLKALPPTSERIRASAAEETKNIFWVNTITHPSPYVTKNQSTLSPAIRGYRDAPPQHATPLFPSHRLPGTLYKMRMASFPAKKDVLNAIFSRGANRRGGERGAGARESGLPPELSIPAGSDAQTHMRAKVRRQQKCKKDVRTQEEEGLPTNAQNRTNVTPKCKRSSTIWINVLTNTEKDMTTRIREI